MASPTQRIHRMLSTYFSLGNRTETADGSVVVTNPEFPLLVEANLVHTVRLREEQDVESFIQESSGWLRQAGAPRSHVMIDPGTRPENLAKLLKKAKFQSSNWIAAIHQPGHKAEGHPRVEVRGIAEKSTWAQFSQLRREILAAEGHTGVELDQRAALVRRRSLSSNVRYYLALLDFDPVGHIGLVSIGSSGMLVDLAVRPDRRRSGLAQALIRKMVDHSRNLDHDMSCVVYEDREDLSKLFQSMGFEPAANYTSYISR